MSSSFIKEKTAENSNSNKEHVSSFLKTSKLFFTNNTMILNNDTPVKVPVFQSSFKDIEKIILSYIKQNKSHISNLNHANIIANYLFKSYSIQKYIKFNDLTINDFVPLILTSKIIYSNGNKKLFNEKEKVKGCFVLLKGGFLCKSTQIFENKKKILRDYNLKESDVYWKNSKNDKFALLFRNKLNCFNQMNCVFKQNKGNLEDEDPKFNFIYELNEENINNFSENDLNICNGDKYNKTLFFGGLNYFNNHLMNKFLYHLTSAYTLNYENNSSNEIKNLLLYLSEDSLINFHNKVINNKNKCIKFIIEKIIPIKEFTKDEKLNLFSDIELFDLNIKEKKFLICDKNTFYLVYKGSCSENNNINIIYDKGTFIGLHKIFNQNDNEKAVCLFSKTPDTFLFKINISSLSIRFTGILKKFLYKIYINQIKIHNKYTKNAYINEFKNFKKILNITQKTQNQRKMVFLSMEKLKKHKNYFSSITSPSSSLIDIINDFNNVINKSQNLKLIKFKSHSKWDIQNKEKTEKLKEFCKTERKIINSNNFIITNNNLCNKSFFNKNIFYQNISKTVKRLSSKYGNKNKIRSFILNKENKPIKSKKKIEKIENDYNIVYMNTETKEKISNSLFTKYYLKKF